jgi:hypothetical protein
MMLQKFLKLRDRHEQAVSIIKAGIAAAWGRYKQGDERILGDGTYVSEVLEKADPLLAFFCMPEV